MQEEGSKTSGNIEFYSDTMEFEKKNKDMMFINNEKGIFAGHIHEGINNNKSVFDKTAVFHVGKGE